MPDEFDLIASIRAAIMDLQLAEGTLPTIGDDCAVLTLPPENELAISSDLYVSGVHFPVDLDATSIAGHCLSGAISDLAAVGASPLAMMLAVSARSGDWIQQLIPGCAEIIKKYDLALVGGDISQGEPGLCVTVMGQIAKGMALPRSGAKSGDDIWLSGYLGEAVAGLRLLGVADRSKLSSQHRSHLINRFCFPSARIELGAALVGVASAAIDISDGLISDLGHVLVASKVSAQLFPEGIKISPALAAFIAVNEGLEPEDFTLNGGDDYELCFTAPAGQKDHIEQIGQRLGLQLTRIGIIEDPPAGLKETPGLRWRSGHTLKTAGYRHFAS